MTTDVSIANVALLAAQKQTIVALTGNVNVDTLFIPTRERLLRGHDWNFARKRVQLAQLAAVPVSGFDLAYQIPSDWIRTIVVSDSDLARRGVPYRQEQDQILSDAQQIFLTYEFKVTDPADFPPDFAYYFSMALSVLLASTSTVREEQRKERLIAENKAKSADSIEDDIDALPPGDWETDRNR